MTAPVTARVLLLAPLVLLAAAGGCKKDRGTTHVGDVRIPFDARDDVAQAEQQVKREPGSAAQTEVSPGVRNTTLLTPAPAAVRASFDRDFPNTAVTSMETPTAASGGLLYRIGYMTEDGRAASVTYHANGQLATEDAPQAPTPAGNNRVTVPGQQR